LCEVIRAASGVAVESVYKWWCDIRMAYADTPE
jgi:hypothetical protein